MGMAPPEEHSAHTHSQGAALAKMHIVLIQRMEGLMEARLVRGSGMQTLPR